MCLPLLPPLIKTQKDRHVISPDKDTMDYCEMMFQPLPMDYCEILCQPLPPLIKTFALLRKLRPPPLLLRTRSLASRKKMIARRLLRSDAAAQVTFPMPGPSCTVVLYVLEPHACTGGRNGVWMRILALVASETGDWLELDTCPCFIFQERTCPCFCLIKRRFCSNWVYGLNILPPILSIEYDKVRTL
jgi:hypothetical protein